MSRIVIDHKGALKVSGTQLPCLVTRVGGRGKIIIDSSKVEGSSGRRKVFDGWDDWDMTLDAIIYEPDERAISRYDHLRTVNNAFKHLEDGLPVIYSLESQLASALNVRQVLFAGLDVTDDSRQDAIELSLRFTEHDPVVGLVQQQQADRDRAATETAARAGGEPTESAEESVADTAVSQEDMAALRDLEEMYG